MGLALGRALRPRQWIKNLLVFAAPLFAYALDVRSFIPTFGAFVAFCAVSSAGYLINDLLDREEDRRHPVKRKRPIAAGDVPVSLAAATAAVFLVAGLGLGLRIGPALTAILAAYLVNQLLYTLFLKRVLILDVMALAAGFLYRAVAGGLAAGVELSSWFLLCVALLSLYIGIEKRKAELIGSEQGGLPTRRILNAYSLPFLQQMEAVIMACALLTYSLWAIQAARSDWMLITLPFVIYGLFRFQHIASANRELGERPEEIFLTDRPTLINLVLWGLTCLLILKLEQ